MCKRSALVLCLLLITMMVVMPAGIALAQTTPDAINDALADLSSRVGTTVTLSDLSSWRWSQQNYPDTSLGCPQAGQVYAQVVTNGYQFLLTYSGVTYDYRVSVDRQILILCSQPATTTPPSTPTPAEATVSPTLGTAITPTATQAVVGRVVCADAMPTRLVAGAQARTTVGDIPVNIRREPDTASAILGQVPTGSALTILDGPQCAENMVWWRIDYQTLVGWIAEGRNNIYWLDPVGAALTPTPHPEVTPAAAATQPVAPQIYDLDSDRTPITVENADQLGTLRTLEVNDSVRALAWSANGATLAAAGDQGVWLWSTAAFSLQARLLRVPDAPAYSVTFSPIEALLASAHADGTIRLWDVTTGGQRAVLSAHTAPVRALAFSPDGKTLASGAGDETTGADSTIRLWDLDSRSAFAMLNVSAPVTTLAFSPDGTLLAFGSQDGTVQLVDVVSVTPASMLEGHEGPVLAVAFCPDGAVLVSAGEDSRVYVWDTAARTYTALENHTTPVRALAFSPPGDVLVSGGGSEPPVEDSAIRLWDFSARTLLSAINVADAENSGGLISGIVFSPDGTVLVIAAAENSRTRIEMWGFLPGGFG